MNSTKYHGAWPTMVTPFDKNGQIDAGAVRAVVEWYVDRGVGGVYANCLSSEMYALDDDERLLLVSQAVDAARGRVPVAATGNLGESVDAHVALSRRVADAGADVVMLVVPTFCDGAADLERYYLTMAAQVAGPLGLYECPVPRPYHLSVDLVGRLAATGRFHAFKETSGDRARIEAHLRATAGTPLSVLQANTPYLLAALQAGGQGTMSVAATWLPDLVAAVIAKSLAGDPDATRLHNVLCSMELAQRAVHPQGTKHLLSRRGLPVTPHSRVKPAMPTAETLFGLDRAADRWFSTDGHLRVLQERQMTSALLIIDAQGNMFDEAMPVYQANQVLETIQELARHARMAGAPVIYLRNNGGPDEPDQPGTPGWHIHPQVAPQPDEIIVDKRGPDGFDGTDLQARLTALGVDRLILAGMQTEMCVNTTARRASALGYEVILAADGHTTFDFPEQTAAEAIAEHNAKLVAVANVIQSADIAF